MAPLFSTLVFVPGAVVLSVIAFAVARFLQPTSIAVRIAFVFVIGSAVGGIATVVGFAFLVGASLSATWQVIVYLASLAVGALVGGVLLVVLCIKLRVLTLRSSGPPQATSA